MSVVKLISETSNPFRINRSNSHHLDIKSVEKQEILDFPLILRMKKVHELLSKEITILEIEKPYLQKHKSNLMNYEEKYSSRRKKAINKELEKLREKKEKLGPKK